MLHSIALLKILAYYTIHKLKKKKSALFLQKESPKFIGKYCCYCCLVAKSCLTLCDPMDCSPPGPSDHGIFQARILEWVAISFSRGSSQPRNQTCVSCIGSKFFTAEPPGKHVGKYNCFEITTLSKI